jgi:multidrug efflux pump subunit AcrB
VETAIHDGADQIVIPAIVSLMCICIAFVPMFTLGGGAGYLFKLLAEAVILALVASFILSRTLVPPLANHLLKAQAETVAEPGLRRNVLVRFHQASSNALKWFGGPIAVF